MLQRSAIVDACLRGMRIRPKRTTCSPSADKRKSVLRLRLSQLVVVGCILAPVAAHATCTMPNTLTNGQPTDATQVMGNFSALSTCLTANGGVASGSAGQVGVYSSSGNQLSGQSVSGILDSNIGSTQGTIAYRGASGWQGLAPGSPHYVLSTNGAGSDPAWVAQSGGSGGGKYQFFPTGSSSYSVGASANMNVIHVANSISVTDLAALFNPVGGATYEMGIAGWDATNSKITNTPTYTPTQTVGTGGTNVPLFFSYSTPLVLTAGDYAVMLIRTDGTTTTGVGLYYGGGTYWGPQAYMNGNGTVYALTSQSPTTSDVWTYEGGGWWDFALMYTY